MTSTPLSPSPAADPLARRLGYLSGDPENEALRADIFDLALAGGQWDVAQAQVVWVLERRPADFGWRHRLALLDMARQEWDEAAVLLHALIAEGQTDPALHYNLAYIDFARGLYEGALARLSGLSDPTRRVEAAVALQLRCLHRLGRLDDALAFFEQQRSTQPDSAAFGAAALVALDAGHVDDARRWAGLSLEREPRQVEALVTRGSLRLGDADPKGAREDLELALAGHRSDGRIWSALGMTYLFERNVVKARSALRQAVATMPDHIGTWHGLGWCEVLGGDLPAALKAFETALELDRNFAESHGGVAVVLALQGTVFEAEGAIRRARGLDASNLSSRYAEAVLNGDTRDAKQFERLARSALSQRKTTDGRTLADIVMGRR